MPLSKWTHSERKVLFEHPRITLMEDTVNLPDGTTMPYLRAVPSSKNSVAVIAVNDKGQLLVQREYSYPPDEIMWQLPGGGVDDGEDILEAAKRELSEESGYSAKSCKLIGYYFTANRLWDQKQYVVVCTDLVKSEAKADHGEFIESYWFARDEVSEKVANGEITNINFLACLQLWEHSK